jgi:predicted RNA polymerase sigma factor
MPGCLCSAAEAAGTGWRQIVGLCNELLRYEPTPVVAANRAAAVAMADGPEAGLMLLENLNDDPAVARWPQLHIAVLGCGTGQGSTTRR